MVGIFEVAAALLILIKPVRPVLFAFFIWKMASELFYPHYNLLEWIERGGSYGTLLALWLTLKASAKKEHQQLSTFSNVLPG
jgi:hypothetical protein